MTINMVRDIHRNVLVTITHEQATDAIANLEQVAPLPGMRDDRSPLVHGEIANKGEEPQAKRDDGTKRPEEDHPNEPAVSSMEKPATAMMADSVASDSTCPSVRTNGCDSASWFTRPQIYPTLPTPIRHV